MSIKDYFVFLAALIMAGMHLSDSALAAQPEETTYYLLNYAPGTAWNSETGLRQKDLAEHQTYLMTLFNNDYLVLAGGLEQEAETLIVLRSETLEQARRLASQDPAVQSNVLAVSVKSWRINKSSVRFVSRRSPDNSAVKEGPFILKRLNPQAPLKQQSD